MQFDIPRFTNDWMAEHVRSRVKIAQYLPREPDDLRVDAISFAEDIREDAEKAGISRPKLAAAIPDLNDRILQRLLA